MTNIWVPQLKKKDAVLHGLCGELPSVALENERMTDGDWYLLLNN